MTDPTPELTPKAQQTRQRILETALNLIITQGYEANTMRDIAEAADCSVGLTYRYFDRKEARKYDLYAQYGLVSADEAIKDSGINLDTINKERIGVIWGSGIGGLFTFYEEVASFANGDGTPRFSPFFIPKMIADIAAGHISIKYGFMGHDRAPMC